MSADNDPFRNESVFACDDKPTLMALPINPSHWLLSVRVELRETSMLRCLCSFALALGFMVGLLPRLSSAAAQEPKKAGKLDPAAVGAWAKHGAEAGWHGRLRGGTPLFRPDPKDLVDALPCFRFPKGDDLDLGDLPAISVPFAIVLEGRQTTPATLKGVKNLKNLTRIAVSVNGESLPVERLQKLKGLDRVTSLFWFGDMSPAQAKEVKEFKHLNWLYIQDTLMKDESLKELNGLKSLTYLGTIGTPNISAAGWKELQALPSLTTLDIKSSTLTDAVLKEWNTHKNLASLNLASSQVTDAGLKGLEVFSKLAALDLSRTKVSTAGMKPLKRLKALTALNLSGTQLTDKGLEDLKELDTLVSLNLNGTQVTDAGLKELKNLRRLAALHLGRTKVTNAGLKDLRELKNLTALTLYYTGVTNDGLEDLKVLGKLEMLDLSYTKTTEEGRKKLQDALPRCRIRP